MNHSSSISALTQKNVDAIAQMEAAAQKNRTQGERISDAVAKAIGSWNFIIVQSVLLVLWMILNLLAWSFRWDPYPFILLNLMLSFQAAFTGPVLLISQNRQTRFMERRHRLDLQINMLAEQESTETLRLLKLLCEKSGVSIKGLGRTDQLVQDTRPETIAEQIITSTESESPHSPASSPSSPKPPLPR